MGESRSRQDHLNFYKWLYFEFIAPIPVSTHQIQVFSPHLGNFLRLGAGMAG
jgi:hypothetical protein